VMGALGTGFRGGSPLLLFLRLSEAAALFSPDSKPLSCGDGFRTPTRGGTSTGIGSGGGGPSMEKAVGKGPSDGRGKCRCLDGILFFLSDFRFNAGISSLLGMSL
jgi:hypothetical protein